MQRSIVILAAVSFALAAPAVPVLAQTGGFPQGSGESLERLSADQLDDLVAPIALYPDPLLAQVLVAATFADQIDEAAGYVRSRGTDGIEDQAWDISVKAVAHYPSALNLLADRSEWTEALGYAYANQSSDVMQAVQRMRSQAAAQGNLVTTPQQQVIAENDTYAIVPAQPRVIYVPVYDPYVIYSRPIFGVGFSSRYWSFGLGFPIGSWLTYDLDWRARSVYYNGWSDAYVSWGGGWRFRSRPFISITNVYVNPRYRTVYVNRNVGRRGMTWYGSRDRFSRSRPGSYSNTRRDDRRDDVRRDVGGRSDDRRRMDTREPDRRGGTFNGYDGRNIPSRGTDGREGGARGTDSRSSGGRDNGYRGNDSRGNDARGPGDSRGDSRSGEVRGNDIHVANTRTTERLTERAYTPARPAVMGGGEGGVPRGEPRGEGGRGDRGRPQPPAGGMGTERRVSTPMNMPDRSRVQGAERGERGDVQRGGNREMGNRDGGRDGGGRTARRERGN